MTTKFISLFNENDFIRVTDADQNTTVYFNKVNLSVQMDNTLSFYLKNDSNIGFYNFADVSYPLCSNVKELVYKLVEWCKYKVDSWDFSKAVSLVELQMNVDSNSIEFDQLALNNATSLYDAGLQNVRMTVGTFNAKVVRQSKMYVNYRLGQDILAVVSGTIVEPPRMVGGRTVVARNVISRIGMYEDSVDITSGKNYSMPGKAGFFFQYEAKASTDINGTATVVDTLSVVLRRDSMPDLVIPQASWNIDKLNGQGASVVNVDWKKNVTFVFEMRNRQGTVMRLGVMYNDLIVFCHEFSDSGLFSGSLTSNYQPSVPIRWEMRGNGVSTNTCEGSMLQGYAIVYGKQDRSNNDIRVFAVGTTKPKLLLSNESNKNLIALSLMPSRIRCRIQITKVQIINTQTGFAKWDLIIDPQRRENGVNVPILAENAFTDVVSTSVRRCETDDIITHGIIIASGYIGSNSIDTVDLDSQFANVMAKIVGTPDIIALRVSGMYGTANVSAAITWREYI